ncbi:MULTISPECIES: amino acid deaminase [unclassified Variovorax]|uniref:amino acid deaminase n=1 Tax=unclassified Variovorax TaxID=663243 RepID=UPI00076DEB34|nr:MULTISPECIES: amino acid deaminase [unclassified Variovorax]KWT65444.1 D-serine deaminase [Variovorax sp. WDL1]PNG52903.1 D-threonine aldolase [Variovorax sp. B2]PNG53475.1 D-threonine aldolase [Variovorax sp. B4]VTV10889.1 D-threonine aldolase [Variovorax sp. WDL1]
MTTTDDQLFDPLFDTRFKGYPHTQPPRRRSEIGQAGWHVLAGNLPLPLAVLKREALEHNLAWMQARVREWGIDLAPHGKTTMSPQLFRRQLDAGAWGLTFATVTQLAVGVAAGARRTLIANQVVNDEDLAGIQLLLHEHTDLRVVFLVDSLAQLALIEAWRERHHESLPFEVMLEVGVQGGRTGCRHEEEALALATALHRSPAVRLVGIECYEGLAATGETGPDTAYADALMDRVESVARHCDAKGLFEGDEVIVSAGGSAIFDLVAGRLKPALKGSVRGILRSGCYVTHDHGFYKRMLRAVDQRLGCQCGEGEGGSLRPAMEVWAMVQSRPEPGLAILGVGKRDLSFDLSLPVPIARAARGSLVPKGVPADWKITGLNDQHAYLRWDDADSRQAPVVGDRIGLGISHPCTTFDKWRWMPVVEEDYRVSDAVSIHF